MEGVSDSRFPKLEEGRIPLLDDSHVAMRSIWMPAFNAVYVCVPAARFRSMT